MISQKVRFAIVSAGSKGRSNADSILDDGRGEIVAVCDANSLTAKQAAADFHVSAVFSDVDLSYLPLDVSEMSTLIMGTECGFLECGGVLRQMSNQGPSPSDTLINQFDGPPVTPMGSIGRTP